MDRFSRGFIAGVVGGIIMNIWSFLAYHFLGFSTLRYVDWASVVLYGRLPYNLLEISYALVIQLLWVGFLGVLFAYLIPQVTSQGYLFKGALWGFITGFIIFGLSIALRLPNLTVIPFETAFSQFIGGLIWGIVMAQVLRWLDTASTRN